MKTIKLIFGWCLIFSFLYGCSVGMALSGKEEPNLGAIQVGSTRGEIELHLGSPVKTTTLPDGKRVDIYEYEIGDEPSPGRAAFHGAMDVLTIGLWEIVGHDEEKLRKFEVTPDKFKRWEDCPRTVAEVERYAQVLAELPRA